MKRSKKELSALNSAYIMCRLVEENSANVIAGAYEDENIDSDLSWHKSATEFISWYESVICGVSSTKKNEFVIPDVRVSLPCTHVWQQTDPYWKHCTVCGLIEPLRL